MILLWQQRLTNLLQMPMLLNKPEYAHLMAFRLCSPQAAQDWLSILV